MMDIIAPMDITNIYPEFSSLLDESIQSTVGADKTEMQTKIEGGQYLELRRMRPSSYLLEEKLGPCLSYLRTALSIELLTLKLIYCLGCLKGFCAIVGVQLFSQLCPWYSAGPVGSVFSLVWFTLTWFNILRKPDMTYKYTTLSMDRVTRVYNRNVDHINKCFAYIAEHPEDRNLNNILILHACKIAELFKVVDISYIDCFVRSIEEQVEQALLPDSEPNNIKSDLDPLSIFPENVEDQERQDVLFNGIKRAFWLTSTISEYCTENKEINPLHKKYDHLLDKRWIQVLTVALFLVSTFILPYHALTIACSILMFIFMTMQNRQSQENECAYKNSIDWDNKVSQELCYRPKEEDLEYYHQYLVSSRENLIKALSVKDPSESNKDVNQCSTM